MLPFSFNLPIHTPTLYQFSVLLPPAGSCIISIAGKLEIQYPLCSKNTFSKGVLLHAYLVYLIRPDGNLLPIYLFHFYL